jgi:hypothetical protein
MKTEIQVYKELVAKNDLISLTGMIDALPHSERIKLREELEAEGFKKIARNLYFDYNQQVWIESANFPKKAGAR